MKVLILTGTDRTGKTTLKNEILKITNEFVIVERFTCDQWVYQGEFYENEGQTSMEDCLRIDEKLKNDAIYVYLYADAEKLKNRMQLHKEEKIESKIEKMLFWMEKYMEYLSRTKIPVMRFDTSKISPQDLAKDVVQQVRNFERVVM